MGKEEYGIGILKIRETIGMMPLTTVPATPGYNKEVINLRRQGDPSRGFVAYVRDGRDAVR